MNYSVDDRFSQGASVVSSLQICMRNRLIRPGKCLPSGPLPLRSYQEAATGHASVKPDYVGCARWREEASLDLCDKTTTR